MNSAINNFIFKRDTSTAMSRHRKKHVVLKSKGPHIGLYVKIGNKHKWVCWTSKFERHLLNGLGVKMLHKRSSKKTIN